MQDVLSDESFRAFLPGQQQEDDRSLIVEFFIDKKLMGAKSEAAKRPVYEDREYVKIMIKGQDKQIAVHEVTQEHRSRFPIAYQRFLQQKPAEVIGTPIDMLPGVGPSLAHHLKGINLRSIEDLAQITDENAMQRIGPGSRELVNRAKAWLANQAPAATALQDQLAAERAAREAAERRAEEDRKAFEARIAALEQKPARKGKPKRAKRQPEQPSAEA